MHALAAISIIPLAGCLSWWRSNCSFLQHRLRAKCNLSYSLRDLAGQRPVFPLSFLLFKPNFTSPSWPLKRSGLYILTGCEFLEGCSSTVTTGVSSGSARPSKVTGCSPPWTTSPHPTPTVHLKAPLGDLSCSFMWMWKPPQNPDPEA